MTGPPEDRSDAVSGQAGDVPKDAPSSPEGDAKGVRVVVGACDRKPGRGHDVLNLGLGVQIGVLVGLAIFAGLYSLFSPELRISAMIFLAGVTLGVGGGILTTLVSDAYHLVHQSRSAVQQRGGSYFYDAVWEGIAVGLGILLGALPISLTCSVFYMHPLLPFAVYVMAAILLMVIGISRAPSLRALPSSIAYALLPGPATVLVAHLIGDFLGRQLLGQ